MKQRIINYLFKHLIKTVVVDDVIRVNDRGVLTIGGEIVTENEIRQLIVEAKALEKFTLWRILNETIKQDALDIGWKNSTKMEDLNTCKTMYYALDLQSSIVKLILSREKKV